jgi:hypothetical protein
MAEMSSAFKHRHYVPILKCKSAELGALRLLLPEDKQQMTPLLELSPNLILLKNKKDWIARDLFKKVAEQIAACWGFTPIFIDIELIEALLPLPQGKNPISLFAEVARTFLLRVIPVTGINRSPEYQTAVEKIVAIERRGVCVRLKEDDVRNPLLGKQLKQLLAKFKISEKQVDILVDLKVIGDTSMKLAEICNRIPSLSLWRTFTLACGAFPKDLSKLEKNQEHELSRSDWLYWNGQLKEGAVLPRRPSYGDYAIQCPLYSPPPDNSNPSASIRYTSESYWLIMRGEGLYNEGGAGYDQYWAEANLLSKRKEFCGAGFSKGDKYIYKIGQQTKEKGTPQTWLRAGLNHHLTFVIRQIANSFGSSTGGVPGPGLDRGLLSQQASRISSREAYGEARELRQLRLID